jgi:hypothetical protein
MSNDDQRLIAVLAITELILRYGVPAALQIITAWNVEEPTQEDWETLKLKAAEEYFK